MGVWQTSSLLLVWIACMIAGIAAAQGPFFYYNVLNDVDVECHLADFEKEHPNVDKRFLKVTQKLSGQNTTVAFLDLVNWVNKTAETKFVGHVFSLESQKDLGLKLKLLEVQINADERLSYACEVEYGSYDIQTWISRSISFKPASLYGMEVQKGKGITMAVRAAYRFECLYSTNKNVSSASSGGLIIKHYSSDMAAPRTLCPGKNGDSTHDASQVRCRASPQDEFSEHGFWLQFLVFNPDCSNEGVYICSFSSPSSQEPQPLSSKLKVLSAACSSDPTTVAPHTDPTAMTPQCSKEDCLRYQNSLALSIITPILVIVIAALLIVILVIVFYYRRAKRGDADGDIKGPDDCTRSLITDIDPSVTIQSEGDQAGRYNDISDSGNLVTSESADRRPVASEDFSITMNQETDV